MNRPARVLHIITGLGVGGAEQQLRLLLRRLPMRCEVLALTNPGAVAEGIRADGTPVRHLGMCGNRDLSALPRLVRLIREGGYDLVHTHLYRACVYGRLAARLAGVQDVVATEHSLGDTAIEGRPLTAGTRGLYLATERLGRATVAVSATVADRLRAWGVPGDRIHVVPNGIDAARFRHDPAARATARSRLGLATDATVVGGVGRLVQGKRFDRLIRACAAQPGVRLLLVGDGPERPSLLRLARELGVADRVLLPGECGGAVDGRPGGPGLPGLPELLAAMDLFVSPSTGEAFGLSVLEALAAGLPVLHVTCPAIDDAPRAEAPGAYRIGAETAQLTAALRVHLAAGHGRQPVPPVVARYDIARSAERLLEVYAHLTRTGRDPARAAAGRPETDGPHTRLRRNIRHEERPMTETVDNARTASSGKRRSRKKSRRRPQSRNPSTPMDTPEDRSGPPGTVDGTPSPPPGTQREEPASDGARSGAASESVVAAVAGGPAHGGAAGDAEEGADATPAPDEPAPGVAAKDPGSAEEDPGGAAKAPDGTPADREPTGGGASSEAPQRSGSAPSAGAPLRAGARRVAEGPSPDAGGDADEESPRSAVPAAAKAGRTGFRRRRAAAARAETAAGPVRTRRVRARLARAASTARRLAPRRTTLPRWWPAALCVLAGALAGLAFGLLRPTQYTATSYVAVVPGKEGNPMTALGFAQAYGRIATDTAVLAGAQEESGVPVATLRGSVEAVTSPDAPMIEITGHAPRAGGAAKVANAVARSLTEVADGSAEATGVELTAFSRARAPREPSTPAPALTTAVGGSAGVLVGALVLLVRPRHEERPARPMVPAPAPVGQEPRSSAEREREKEEVR